jgi:hypothetical protein
LESRICAVLPIMEICHASNNHPHHIISGHEVGRGSPQEFHFCIDEDRRSLHPTIQLFVTHRVAGDIAHFFAYSITHVGPLDQDVLADIFLAIFCSPRDRSIHGGTITCDDPSYPSPFRPKSQRVVSFPVFDLFYKCVINWIMLIIKLFVVFPF